MSKSGFSELPEVVNRPLVKKIWEKIAAIFIPNADAACTVGECLADIFRNRYGIPFTTIRNVPDLIENLSENRKNNFPDRKYLLYQGALNVGRGLEELIHAMEKIDLPLKIAGEGDLSVELRQQVIGAGLQNKIEFLGFVKPADLPALTNDAFAGINFLNPFGLSYYYSLANKFFDYIHAGVPTLNSDFPEYHRINEQFEVSLLLNDLTPDTIINSVNRLVQDTELYNTLVKNCLSAKSEFNWQKEQGKLLNLYREL